MVISCVGMPWRWARGSVHLLTLTQRGELLLEIIITKHKGLSVMGERAWHLQTAQRHGPSKMWGQREGGMDTSQLLLNLLRTNLGCGVNILLKLGVVPNVTWWTNVTKYWKVDDCNFGIEWSCDGWYMQEIDRREGSYEDKNRSEKHKYGLWSSSLIRITHAGYDEFTAIAGIDHLFCINHLLPGLSLFALGI